MGVIACYESSCLFLHLLKFILKKYTLGVPNRTTILQDWMFHSLLSYDVVVIQWITSCHKNRMTTRVITLWRVRVTSLTTSVSAMRFLIEIVFILKTIKFLLKCHMRNGILHSWLFHMKFMKLVEGSFHKFHMK